MKASEILKSNMLDIVFEFRNKKYGAYQLRKVYESHLRQSVLLVLFAAILIFSSFMILPTKQVADKGYATVVEFTEKPVFVEKAPAKKPLPLPKTNKVKSVAVVEVRVETDAKVIEEIKVADRNELKEVDISKNTNTEGGNSTGLITDGSATIEGNAGNTTEDKKEPTKTADAPLDIAEVNPSFVGGYAAMLDFLAKNIRYPAYGIDNGIEGKVIVQFVVDEVGNIVYPKVIRGLGGEFDVNAIEAVRRMPKWNPGKQHGTAVKVRFTLPITYNLNRG